MLAQRDFQVQISSAPFSEARPPLAGKPQVLPSVHALRNGDIERARLQHGTAARIEHRRLQRNRALRSAIAILQIDHHFGVMILTGNREADAGISIFQFLICRASMTGTGSVPCLAGRRTITTGFPATK